MTTGDASVAMIAAVAGAASIIGVGLAVLAAWASCAALWQ